MNTITRRLFISILAGGCAVIGCSTDDPPLAPYQGDVPRIATLRVEENVFSPRVTWTGGYVTAFGVNRGGNAALDSTLVALFVSPNDGIPYQTKIGALPAGAQDLTTQYGGLPASRLVEDQTYTFWVMRGDAWSQIVGQRGKKIYRDTAATSLIRVSGDTIFASTRSHERLTRLLDVYLNVKDVRAYGRLGVIDVVASDSSQRPRITFRITQTGVTDTTVAAIGVVRGGTYNVQAVAWEMISKEVRPDTVIYWKTNVIPPRLTMGESVPGTETFITYPPDGLIRGYQYYIWIAHKDWDAQNRTRSTPYYAFTTFTVW